MYSHVPGASVANFMNATDMMPYNETWHPRMNSVVYYGMDWLCPGYDIALYRQLTAYFGNISLANTMQYITPIVQTGSILIRVSSDLKTFISGDLHIAIYDLTNQILWTANARRDGLICHLTHD